MLRRTRLLVTVASGTTRRGKYTLPNMFAFSMKVRLVWFRHSEKYVQRQMPAR